MLEAIVTSDFGLVVLIISGAIVVAYAIISTVIGTVDGECDCGPGSYNYRDNEPFNRFGRFFYEVGYRWGVMHKERLAARRLARRIDRQSRGIE